ncbi:MAG TPA: VWA domain-containing protein [Elusimicrobiota bacterium]|nr:VWA domain-containing protein [Elusimicrobiota bacterium]
MNFADPVFLLLIPALALLVWGREAVAGRFRAKLPFPNLAIVRSLPANWRTEMGRLPQALLYSGLVLAMIALARPRSIVKGEEARARGIDIMIALDTSGSMRALDFDPLDRMAEAKKATRTFIMHRQYDRIGLVAFAGVSILQCPLTLDYAALLDFLDQVDVGVTTTENTAIGTAIATAANHLKKSAAKSKVIILVTDGRNNSGEIDPLTAAKAAAGLGIRIYTIGVGIRGTSKIPVDTAWGKQIVPIEEDLDEPALTEIANATGGRYYRASSSRQFDEIYSDIDHLEKSEIKGPATQEYNDHYIGWLMLAMIFICAGLGLELTVLRTAP